MMCKTKLAKFVLLFSLTLFVIGQSRYTSSQTQTITPSPQEAIEAINQLWLDEACVYPCFLGLEIGESKRKEITVFFDELFPQYTIYDNRFYSLYVGTLADFTDESLGKMWEREYNSVFAIFAWIDKSDNILVGIGIWIPAPELHIIDWLHHNPAYILNVYGTPNTVIFNPPLILGGAPFGLTIKYTNLQIFAYYETENEVELDNRTYTFCSDLPLRTYEFRLEFYANNVDIADLYDTPSDLDYWLNPTSGRPITEVTQLRLAEFTQTFSEEGSCITTKPWDQW